MSGRSRPHLSTVRVRSGIFWTETCGDLIGLADFSPPSVSRSPAEDIGRAEQHLERKWDDGVQNVEDFPEDAARWTGEAVGAVESVPDRVEDGWDRTEDRVEAGWDRTEDRVEAGWDRTEDRVEDGWDNTVEAVEDAPSNVAEWVGEGVGKVEHFGDEVEDYGDRLEQSYDQGRDEERY